MLSAEQVKPLLLHQDGSVRSLAAAYFRHSWSRETDLVPLILRAGRQYGFDENLNCLPGWDHFPVVEESLDELLQVLAEANDEETIQAIHRSLTHAPGEILLCRRAILRDAENLPNDVFARIERREELSGWTAQKLWQKLEGFDGRCSDNDLYEDLDFEFIDDLIDALSRHDEPSEELICYRLRSLVGSGQWLESFLVDLSGERRISRAIPLLLDHFVRDEEFLAEQASAALAKIGDPETVRLIRPAYREQPWKFRNYAIVVLESIKHPACEQAILELLESEDDYTLRTMLCWALCNMFSEQGVDVVRRQIIDGYMRMFANLEDHLLTVTDVLGIEVPEAKYWRADREERKRVQDKQRAEMAELERKYRALRARGIDLFDPKPRPLNLAPQVDTTALKQLERPKVGRNEACPCGSGKKYKKCCGRRF